MFSDASTCRNRRKPEVQNRKRTQQKSISTNDQLSTPAAQEANGQVELEPAVQRRPDEENCHHSKISRQIKLPSKENEGGQKCTVDLIFF